MFWAFAKLGEYHEALMQSGADETCRKIHHFDPQGLVSCADLQASWMIHALP